MMTNHLTILADRVHRAAVEKGFWPEDEDRNFGELIALATSELSEALEEDRAGHNDVYYRGGGSCYAPEDVRYSGDGLVRPPEFVIDPWSPLKPEGAAVEVVDCIIRCLDILAYMDVDVDALVEQKLAYNATRGIRHGKAY